MKEAVKKCKESEIALKEMEANRDQALLQVPRLEREAKTLRGNILLFIISHSLSLFY
jgi:hypothetical protein